MKYIYPVIITCMIPMLCISQVTDSTDTDLIDYSQFGDAENVKRYCTQKVLNQTPNRIVSIGYEYQSAFNMPIPFVGGPGGNEPQEYRFQNLSQYRAQINIPVVSTNQFIWQMGANYLFSNYNIEGNSVEKNFGNNLSSNGMHSIGIQSTIFKPLNAKNFMILQLSLDGNASFEELSDVNNRALTLSGLLAYGWKTSDRNLFGIGMARTYRAGQSIILPGLLWNKTFNDHWGMELFAPARGYLRYNVSTSNIIQAGYELEGNQYLYNNVVSGQNLYIQRSELKPRIMWDKKLSGYFWMNLQAGMRINWRFDVRDEYDGRKDNSLLFSSALTNPFYIACNLSFVSP